MDVAAGLAAVAQGLGIAKALRGIEKNIDEATIKAKLADVIESLTDAKLALADAKELLAEKDREIERLRLSIVKNSSIVRGIDNYSYFTDDQDRAIGYPICPKCQEVDLRFVELKQSGPVDSGQCSVCERIFSPVYSILRYEGDKPYTKQDDRRDRREAASRRNSDAISRNRSGFV